MECGPGTAHFVRIMGVGLRIRRCGGKVHELVQIKLDCEMYVAARSMMLFSSASLDKNLKLSAWQAIRLLPPEGSAFCPDPSMIDHLAYAYQAQLLIPVKNPACSSITGRLLKIPMPRIF